MKNEDRLRLLNERRRYPAQMIRDERRKSFKRAFLFMKMVEKNHSPYLEMIDFRPAQSVKEIFTASRLVYNEYVRKKYVLPNESQIKVIIQHLTSSMGTFVAVIRGRIIATLSLVEDSPFGLPIDKSYKRELDDLRNKGRRLAEVSLFAMDNELLSHPKSPFDKSDRLMILMRLFKCMIDYVRSMGRVDMLAAAFLTKHDFFYEILQFAPLGEPKLHQVGPTQVAASARYLDLDYQIKNAPAPFRRFFAFDTPPPPPERFKQSFRFSIEDAFFLLRNLQR